MMALKQYFINTFQMPYIKKVIKKMLKNIESFHFQTTIKSILQLLKVTSATKLFFAIK